MILLDELFRSYGFKELVELIIDKIGVASLIVLFAAFFAAIVYFSALPSKSRFSTDSPRSNAIGVFQQAFYVFSLVLVLMPFISGWGSFLLVIVLYLCLVAPMFLNMRTFGRDFTFDEYVKLKTGGLSGLSYLASKSYGGALAWGVVLGELLAFSYFDPTIPLLGWGIIIYCLAVAVLQAALVQSILFNIRSCAHARIVTAGGIVEGFIVAKGSDHYVVKTRVEDLLLANNYVKSISPVEIPK